MTDYWKFGYCNWNKVRDQRIVVDGYVRKRVLQGTLNLNGTGLGYLTNKRGMRVEGVVA